MWHIDCDACGSSDSCRRAAATIRSEAVRLSGQCGGLFSAILIVETKSGNARLSQQQRRFFNNGESVTFVGNNKGNINSKSYNKTTVDTSIERIK